MDKQSLRSRFKARQLIVYDGMVFGSISPTDIDAIIEYKDKAFVVYECKFSDAEMPRGQYIALTRIVDDLQAANKEAILLICEHNVKDARLDVKLADVPVRQIYYKKQFHRPRTVLTAKEMTERFFRYVDKKMPPAGTDGAIGWRNDEDQQKG